MAVGQEAMQVTHDFEAKRANATLNEDVLRDIVKGNSKDVDDAVASVSKVFQNFREKLWGIDMHKWWDPVWTDVKQAIAFKDITQKELNEIQRKLKTEIGVDPNADRVNPLLNAADRIKTLADRLGKLGKIIDKNDGDTAEALLAWQGYKQEDDVKLAKNKPPLDGSRTDQQRQLRMAFTHNGATGRSD